MIDHGHRDEFHWLWAPNGSVAIFRKEFLPQQTGRLGYSIRVSPNHYDDPLTRPCYPLLKWG